MKKYWLLTFILLFSRAVAGQEPLIIAGDNFPPYLDRTAKGNGWAWQIAERALETAEIAHQFEFAPWARVLASAAYGRTWHAVFPAYYSEQRAKHFYYSSPVIQTKLGLFKLKKNTHIQFSGNFDDLAGLSIGNCRDCTVREDFDNNESLNKVTVANLDAGIQMLLSERVDLLVGNYHVNHVKMNAMLAPGNRYGLSMEDVEFIDPIIQLKPVYLAISKKVPDHQAIIARFNEALLKVNKLEEIQLIYQLNDTH